MSVNANDLCACGHPRAAHELDDDWGMECYGPDENHEYSHCQCDDFYLSRPAPEPPAVVPLEETNRG